MAGNKELISGVSPTAFLVLLAKCRVLLFPEQYVNEKGERFNTKPNGPILKDSVLLEFVRWMIVNHPDFEKIEMRFYGDNKVVSQLKAVDAKSDNTIKPALDRRLLLAILVREKYFRRSVSQCIKNNAVKQIVLLGAGLDSFSVRKLKYPVTFYEIDKSEIIELKKVMMNDIATVQDRIKLLAADYVRGDLFSLLVDQGFDLAKPTMVVWGGNTMYLNEDSVKKVLLMFKEKLKECYFTFDYLHPAATDLALAKEEDDRNNDALLSSMISRMKANGAGFKFSKSPAQMKQFLSALGCSVIDDRLAADFLRGGIEKQPIYTQENYSYLTLAL